jgi:plasmid maintenance system killer protein
VTAASAGLGTISMQFLSEEHQCNMYWRNTGQHSIRINGQWRLCFVWVDGNATRVEIVDYH